MHQSALAHAVRYAESARASSSCHKARFAQRHRRMWRGCRWLRRLCTTSGKKGCKPARRRKRRSARRELIGRLLLSASARHAFLHAALLASCACMHLRPPRSAPWYSAEQTDISAAYWAHIAGICASRMVTRGVRAHMHCVVVQSVLQRSLAQDARHGRQARCTCCRYSGSMALCRS